MEMINYLYLDDEIDTSTEAIRDGLNDTGLIHVDLEPPLKFEDQLQDLHSKLEKYDGIILDLRLDDNPQSQAKYTAPPLAQSLRTEASLGKLKECPIVLCSTDSKISKSSLSQQNMLTLFDYIFLKDGDYDLKEVVKKLLSLSHGYKDISNRKGNLNDIFQREINELDKRILSGFTDPESKYSDHDLAQYIINELLLQPGPLIDEDLLAARLGIDISMSTDWQKVLGNIFSPAEYKGVFFDGWRRWWADSVLSIYRDKCGKRLSSLNAIERVKILRDVTGIQDIMPAEPIPRSISINFWTICEFYKKPLDPLEGFRISSFQEPKPWQDNRYLSIDAALERRGYIHGLRIHASEFERFEMIKAQIREKEKK